MENPLVFEALCSVVGLWFPGFDWWLQEAVCGSFSVLDLPPPSIPRKSSSITQLRRFMPISNSLLWNSASTLQCCWNQEKIIMTVLSSFRNLFTSNVKFISDLKRCFENDVGEIILRFCVLLTHSRNYFVFIFLYFALVMEKFHVLQLISFLAWLWTLDFLNLI